MCGSLSVHGSKHRKVVWTVVSLLAVVGTVAARPVDEKIERKSLNSSRPVVDPAFRSQTFPTVRVSLHSLGDVSNYNGAATNDSTCPPGSPAELVALSSLPGEQLRHLIVNCPVICLAASGKGQPDLAGRGVIISYCGQLFYAILFGPVQYAFSVLLDGLRPLGSHDQPRWMGKLRGTAIWTNVIFCLAVCLACCARQYRSDIEPYERVLIRRIAGLTQYSAVLALSAYLDSLERQRLLWCCVFTIAATGIAAEVAAAMPAHRTMDGILQACGDALRAESYPWLGAVALPYITKDRIPALCLALGILGAWMAVWAYLRWLFSRGQNKTAPRPATLRYAVIAFFALTLGIFGFAVYFLEKTVEKHICLSYAPQTAEDGETHWGVGQIAAPFAWLGLTVDIAYELVSPAATPETQPISYQILHAAGAALRTRLRHVAPRSLYLPFLRLVRTATTPSSAPLPSPETLDRRLRSPESNSVSGHTAQGEASRDDGSDPENARPSSAPTHTASADERREKSTPVLP